MSKDELTFGINQWVIVGTPYSWEIQEIVEVKNTVLKTMDDNGWKRINTVNKHKCVYCGSEDQARKLLERLISSESLCFKECRDSSERRNSRDSKLISDARAALQPGGGK